MVFTRLAGFARLLGRFIERRAAGRVRRRRGCRGSRESRRGTCKPRYRVGDAGRLTGPCPPKRRANQEWAGGCGSVYDCGSNSGTGCAIWVGLRKMVKIRNSLFGKNFWGLGILIDDNRVARYSLTA